MPVTGVVASSFQFGITRHAIAFTSTTSPYVFAYYWASAGFGSKFADPATIPSSSGAFSSFSPGSTLICIGLQVYPWSNGFGTKYTDLVSPPTGATRLRFNPATTVATMKGSTSPYFYAYAWSSGFGSKFADPASLPTSANEGIFNNAGTAVVVSMSGSPYLAAYPWSSGFGTIYANPASLPSGAVSGTSFNTADDVLAVNTSTSPYVNAYAWSSGFGSKYADPSSLPFGAGNGVPTWKFDGTSVVFPLPAQSGATAPVSYTWSAGFGSRGLPQSGVAGGNSVSFNRDGLAIAFTGAASGISVYPFGVGYSLTKYSNPPSAPTNSAAVSFV